MTLLSDIAALATVQVGTGGGASAAYPVLSRTQRVSTEGVEGVTPRRVTVRTWTIRALAGAASTSAVQALRDTLESMLVRSGERVRLTERGGTRDLPAHDGTNAGSMPGYPTVELGEVGTLRIGPYVGFDLTCTSRIASPDAAADNVVSHDASIEEATDYQSGEVTTTGSGTVVVAPAYAGGAKAWILANVIDDLEDAVDLSGEKLTYTITTGPDATRATYRYTVAPADSVTGGSGIVTAGVIDETSETSGAASIRRISGDATGANAVTFAAGQEPTPGTGEALVRRVVTEPQISDGRVAFTYELLIGVADAYFGAGRYITRWQSGPPESVTEGLRIAGFQVFSNTAPLPILGPPLGFRYIQRADVEYIGTPPAETTPLDGVIPFAFSSANLVGPPRRTPRVVSPGVYGESLEAEFFFSTAQSIPAAHEMSGL